MTQLFILTCHLILIIAISYYNFHSFSITLLHSFISLFLYPFLSPGIDVTNESDTPSFQEAENVLSAIGRFKEYTRLMSDEALVRLMTSLVTLSLNSYGTSITHSPHTNPPSSSSAHSTNNSDNTDKSNNNTGSSGISGTGAGTGISFKGTRPIQPQRVHSLPYIQESVNLGGIVNFSLETVIEVTKLNGFRASCIWQMVTSHLRIIASMKSGGTRFLAVAATLDIVKCTLCESAGTGSGTGAGSGVYANAAAVAALKGEVS